MPFQNDRGHLGDALLQAPVAGVHALRVSSESYPRVDELFEERVSFRRYRLIDLVS